MNISVLGAGAYGGALGEVLKRNGQRVKFFDPYKYPDVRLEDVLKGVEVIILCTPAERVREVLGQVPEKYSFRPLVVATKGVMALSEYTRKFFKVEILAGPGFASEILSGKKVKLTVGAEGERRSVCAEIFEGSQVTIEETNDRAGVLFLGGLKNIYAIAAGERGLKLGTEEFKEYIGAAIREAEKFLLLNGGFLETTRLAAGLGDFVLTCGSRESRNYTFGMNGYKKIKNETVEGLFAAREIRVRKMKIPAEAKILSATLTKIWKSQKK